MANSVKQLNRTTFRVLLDALVSAGQVTIGFAGSGADVELPPVPDWKPYHYAGVAITLQDLVKVGAPVVLTDVNVAVPISIVKSGTTQADFLITVHNDLGAESTTSGLLELYIERAEQ